MKHSPLAAFVLPLIAFCFAAAPAQQGETSRPAQAVESAKKPSEEKPKYEVQLQLTAESLTRGYGTWRSAAVYAQRRFESRRIVWGMYRASERNRQRDTEFIGGVYQPLREDWAVTAEGMYSPTRRFVGRVSAMAEVEKVVGRGLVVHGGARFTKYDGITAATGYGLAEKYFGNYRAAYTLYVTRLSNAGVAPSHRLQFNKYYGERVNTIGASFSFGREHENLGPRRGILRSDTWSVGLTARHWFTDKLGVSLDGVYHRQGDVYTRRGLTLGLRYRF